MPRSGPVLGPLRILLVEDSPGDAELLSGQILAAGLDASFERAESAAELREALEEGRPEKVSDELGDLIFALVNIGRHVKADPENALRGTNTKFRRRFNHIEKSLGENGETLEEASLERMEDLWQAAKRIERSLDKVMS